MTKTVEDTTAAPKASELAEDVRESARAGQHAASQAVRKFRHTLDEAIPESVQPLRNKIVDSAIQLAEDLLAAQYEFHKSLLTTADRVLTSSDAEHN